MSTSTAIKLSPFLFSDIHSRSVGPEASFVTERFQKVKKDFFESITIGERLCKVSEALWKLLEECSCEDWDGYGAKPVEFETFLEAVRFAETLPNQFPNPEISADPDGEISFDWDEGPRSVFSVSVGKHKNLNYAGLYGTNKNYGTEYFGNELPKTILDNLRRLYSQ